MTDQELIEFTHRSGSQQNIKELEFLVDIIKKNNVKTVLEIGTGCGALTCMLATFTDKVVTVDIERTTKSWEINPDLFPLAKKIKLVIGDSSKEETVKKVRGKYDMVLIDADHLWKGGLADWDNYSDMSNIVGIHDIVGYEERHGTPPSLNPDGYNWFPTEFWWEVKTGRGIRGIDLYYPYETREIIDVPAGGWGFIFKK